MDERAKHRHTRHEDCRRYACVYLWVFVCVFPWVVFQFFSRYETSSSNFTEDMLRWRVMTLIRSWRCSRCRMNINRCIATLLLGREGEHSTHSWPMYLHFTLSTPILFYPILFNSTQHCDPIRRLFCASCSDLPADFLSFPFSFLSTLLCCIVPLHSEGGASLALQYEGESACGQGFHLRLYGSQQMVRTDLPRTQIEIIFISP